MILFLKKQTLKLLKQDYTPQEVLQFAFGCEGGDTDGQGKPEQKRRNVFCVTMQARGSWVKYHG